MKVDLWSILEGGAEVLKFEDKLQEKNFKLNERDIEITEPIVYKGEIYKVGKDLIINIDIKYQYKEKCNRCLDISSKSIKTSLSAKLEEDQEEAEEIRDGDYSMDDGGYENIVYYKDKTLVLDDYIIEQVLLSLPMKTICKDSCKGLCSKCGKNLNTGQCECVHEDIDPRLEKLKDLFPKI